MFKVKEVRTNKESQNEKNLSGTNKLNFRKCVQLCPLTGTRPSLCFCPASFASICLESGGRRHKHKGHIRHRYHRVLLTLSSLIERNRRGDLILSFVLRFFRVKSERLPPARSRAATVRWLLLRLHRRNRHKHRAAPSLADLLVQLERRRQRDRFHVLHFELLVEGDLGLGRVDDFATAAVGAANLRRVKAGIEEEHTLGAPLLAGGLQDGFDDFLAAQGVLKRGFAIL